MARGWYCTKLLLSSALLLYFFWHVLCVILFLYFCHFFVFVLFILLETACTVVLFACRGTLRPSSCIRVVVQVRNDEDHVLYHATVLSRKTPSERKNVRRTLHTKVKRQ